MKHGVADADQSRTAPAGQGERPARAALSPVEPSRRGTTTVEAIKQYILSQRLQPGHALPTEAELCVELGVSRSSVREAIRTLVSLDIVEVRHGHGTTVGRLSLSPLINGLVFRSLLNHDGSLRSLRDVVELRQSIDLAVAEQLIEAYRGGRHEPLHALAEDMSERAGRGESFIQTDRDFHATLLQAVDNTLIQQLVTALWEVHTAVVPELGIAQGEDITLTVEAHRAMLEALEAGDVEAYRRAVRQHYEPLSNAIRRASTA